MSSPEKINSNKSACLSRHSEPFPNRFRECKQVFKRKVKRGPPKTNSGWPPFLPEDGVICEGLGTGRLTPSGEVISPRPFICMSSVRGRWAHTRIQMKIAPS
ncbi:hypothetical protein CEXT_348281 [Caerostris extrusa]|uniref:Uncharacterized protein n=1 Tax=Caerostris extrusa TaxID=172846 RepID=A0AAV4URW5_CAEEX|nr:hypothetical protein CEXT_348281 [Caerostris extrusa]